MYDAGFRACVCVDHDMVTHDTLRLPSQDLVKRIGVYQRYWIVPVGTSEHRSMNVCPSICEASLSHHTYTKSYRLITYFPVGQNKSLA